VAVDVVNRSAVIPKGFLDGAKGIGRTVVKDDDDTLQRGCSCSQSTSIEYHPRLQLFHQHPADFPHLTQAHDLVLSLAAQGESTAQTQDRGRVHSASNAAMRNKTW
jgi:hypothetical protein